MNKKISLLFCILFVYTQSIELKWEFFSTSGKGPEGAKYASAVLDQNENIYIFGGSKSNIAVNTLSVFNTRTNTWESSATQSGMGTRYGHVAVPLKKNSVMLMFGGFASLTGVSGRTNDVYAYDIPTSTWVKKYPSGAIPSIRTLPAATTYGDDTLIIYGGRTDSALGDLYTYNLTENVWRQLIARGPAPVPRAAGTAVTTPEGIVVIYGGWDPKSLARYNDVTFYDVQKNEYLTPTIVGSGTPRDSHTAILTLKKRMIVFGGNNANNIPIVAVECFDLNTNTWTAMSPVGTEPGPRDSVVGVLTSTNTFVIFGGTNSTLANFLKIQIDESDDKGGESFSTEVTDSTTGPSSEDAIVDQNSSEDSKSATTTIIAACGAIGGLIVIAIIVVTLIFILRGKKRRTHQPKPRDDVEMNNEPTSSVSYDSRTEINYAPISSKTTSAAMQIKGLSERGCEILWEEIEIDYELGKGAFGVVYKGSWRMQNVAVKKVIGQFSSEQLEEFTEEASLMSKLRPHDNIVQFIGVCLHPLAIIIKYYEMGSLDSYIQKNNMDVKTTIRIMKDVAAGMGHLHKENIIHRDLASRNVLLQQSPSGVRAIVSDFGFARTLVNDNEGTTKANIGPIKWMAPESLVYRTYSPKSDSWSFGVLMWEIIARDEPWQGIGDVNVIIAVTSGKTLDPPKGCPEHFKNLMLSCWSAEPENRPDMSQIFNTLTTIEKQV